MRFEFEDGSVAPELALCRGGKPSLSLREEGGEERSGRERLFELDGLYRGIGFGL